MGRRGSAALLDRPGARGGMIDKRTVRTLSILLPSATRMVRQQVRAKAAALLTTMNPHLSCVANKMDWLNNDEFDTVIVLFFDACFWGVARVATRAARHSLLSSSTCHLCLGWAAPTFHELTEQ